MFQRESHQSSQWIIVIWIQHRDAFYVYLNQSINKILLLILVAKKNLHNWNSHHVWIFYIFQPFIIISINITFEDLYVSKFFLYIYFFVFAKNIVFCNFFNTFCINEQKNDNISLWLVYILQMIYLYVFKKNGPYFLFRLNS